MFKNRQQAGRLLAEKLYTLLRDEGLSALTIAKECVVIGLPRGGVPVALEVALSLHAPLDVLVSKKIHAPDNPELAIGAVSSSGIVVLDSRIASRYRASEYQSAQVEQAKELIEQTKAKEAYWVKEGQIKPRSELAGKWIVLVDDGIATGMTVVAALRTLSTKNVAKVILATPVIPYDTYLSLSQDCDHLVALSIPYEFSSVGRFYQDFHQVEDQEVIEALRRSAQVAR
jgi:predicted phosphoribosyltransferase